MLETRKQLVVNPYSKCDPSLESGHIGCPVNEMCLLVDQLSQTYDCVCLKEKHFYKVDGLCREFLQPSQSCDMYLSECRVDLNEECVSLNELSKELSPTKLFSKLVKF